MMRSKSFRVKPFLFFAASLIVFLTCIYAIPVSHMRKHTVTAKAHVIRPESPIYLYDSLRLDSMDLSKDAFIYAIKGLDKLETSGVVTNDSIISIVDFSLPSCKKRLFVINLYTGTVLFNTFVSHGRNSGKETATRFSNATNSFASSLGFYVTGDTYKGEHGYSMRLVGVEKGINDNAFRRGIVMHSASYVSEDLIRSQGYIGRSLGCPAVPEELHKAIIGTIKNGSCLFVYSPNKKYIAHTRILRSSAPVISRA